MADFEEWRKIYWESGVWRRFSFEEFVRGVAEIIAKGEKPEQLTLF